MKMLIRANLQDFLSFIFEGLFPLLPLTKGAETARDDIVDIMIGALQAKDQGDLLALGYAFASLVYDTKADKQWLRRRFAMFESTLEDSWFYQEIIQKGIARGIEKGIEQGIEQGIEKGVEQGIEQGELKTLRSILVRFVETHFSELQVLAQQLAERTMVSSLLEKTVNDLLAAQTIEQARLILTEAIHKPS